MQKGKLIVIEGIDSSGKGTQLKLLKDKLERLKKKILLTDFPRYYDSPWGKMVGEYLIGKYGEFNKIDPHLALPLYMLDQYTWSRDIGEPWIKKGGTILLDRYFTSNVHQVAKKKGIAKNIFRDWMWDLGYKELKIKKPDLVLFLDVPPSITRKLLKSKTERLYLKGKKKDGAEKNWKHQEASYKEYIFMTKREKTWRRIKCVTRGKLDSPEVIHQRIWEVVEKELN